MRTEQELKQLLQKYQEGNCTPQEEALLRQWFAKIGGEQQPHELSAEDQERLLDRIVSSPRFAAQKQEEKPYSIRSWQYAAIAAAIAGIILMAWLLRTKDTGRNPVFVQVSTGNGQIRELTLPDGSTVWLNARSTLAYHPDFTRHREIRLSGEAFFTVAADRQHPFTVQTADQLKTTVLGTQFNIRNYEALDQTQITVLSGKVQVAGAEGILGTLTRNQAIRYNRGRHRYRQLEDATAALADWRNGHWQLNDQGVKEIALLLNNQYGITLLNAPKRLDTLHINANFTRQQDAREIITTFCLLAGCRYKWKNGSTVELY